MKLYRAVIEDNNHPEKNGMCRVRVFGVHPGNTGDDFNKISTSDLPWAEVMGSTENGLNSGVGLTKLPRQGTMVYVMFDHDDPNKPIIMGTATGVSSATDASSGFADPAGVYPKADRIGEPDTSRFVRGGDTGVNAIIATNKSEVNDVTNPGANQVEPETLSHLASYTENAVLETASGHVVEMDDTAGNERLRVVHKSGSYVEFRPDGGIAFKSVGAENNYIHVGNLNEHIQGAVKRYIESNIDEIVSGYIKRVVSGALDEKITGAVTQAFEAGQTTTITGDLVIGASGNVTINAGGKVTVNGGTGADLTSGGLTKVDGSSVAIG